MNLSEQTEYEWKNYVLAQYPNEACAYIVDGLLYPVENLSETPEKSFKVSGVERVKAHAKGEVQAFLHSHPYKLEDSPFAYDPSWATAQDMKTWISDNLPWGIVATDGEGLSPMIWYDDSMEAIEPFEGRTFISGKNDCYSIVRDYYRKALNIKLVNGVREMGWWDTDANLYETNFERAGFVEVPNNDIQVNDLALMRMFNDTVCHAAVITDTNTILHHVVNRLSGYDSLAKWNRQIVKYIRYVGVKDA